MSKSDELIRKFIINELMWDSRFDTSQVFVEVKKRKVYLKGEVDNFQANELIEENIKLIPDVETIENKLKIRKDTGPRKLSDTTIKDRIMKIFKWNSYLDESKISVSVKYGNVTISGTVTSLWQKKHVERIVWFLKGIKSVNNKATVEPLCIVEDEVMQKDIEETFTRRERLRDQKITVQVRDGNVTLDGTIKRWYLYQLIENVLENTCGVKSIKNKLRINHKLI